MKKVSKHFPNFKLGQIFLVLDSGYSTVDIESYLRPENKSHPFSVNKFAKVSEKYNVGKIRGEVSVGKSVIMTKRSCSSPSWKLCN